MLRTVTVIVRITQDLFHQPMQALIGNKRFNLLVLCLYRGSPRAEIKSVIISLLPSAMDLPFPFFQLLKLPKVETSKRQCIPFQVVWLYRLLNIYEQDAMNFLYVPKNLEGRF